MLQPRNEPIKIQRSSTSFRHDTPTPTFHPEYFTPTPHPQRFKQWFTLATSFTFATCVTHWHVRKVIENGLLSPAVFPLRSAETPDSFNHVATKQSQTNNEDLLPDLHRFLERGFLLRVIDVAISNFSNTEVQRLAKDLYL